MKNQTNYISINSSESAELRGFMARGDGFFSVPAQQLPSVIPEGLRAKWDSASVIVSGSAGSDGALAVLGHRIDEKQGMLDHDPFVIAVSSSVPQGSGVLVHHASFPSRSVELPQEYLQALESSGLTDYFVKNPPFGVSSGSIENIPPPLLDALKLGQTLLQK